MIAGDWVPRLAIRLRGQYPVALIVDRAEAGHVRLGRLVVNGARRQGVGTAVLSELIAACDEHGDTLSVTPTADFGANVARLTRWYRRFGFTSNTGRRRDSDIEESMYRRPSPTLTPHPREQGKQPCEEHEIVARFAPTPDKEA
jgi:GNAT superfamily N-acetyltransferase